MRTAQLVIPLHPGPNCYVKVISGEREMENVSTVTAAERVQSDHVNKHLPKWLQVEHT